MRNGNRQFDPNTAEFEECSYPTYEEWKHWRSNHFLHFRARRSYPTYEEWKPNKTIDIPPSYE